MKRYLGDYFIVRQRRKKSNSLQIQTFVVTYTCQDKKKHSNCLKKALASVLLNTWVCGVSVFDRDISALFKKEHGLEEVESCFTESVSYFGQRTQKEVLLADSNKESAFDKTTTASCIFYTKTFGFPDFIDAIDSKRKQHNK